MGPLIELVRKMRERKLEPGKFDVLDGEGALLGAMDFTKLGQHHVHATTPWGEVEVGTNRDEDIFVTLDGTLVAILVLNKWITRLTVRFASGQEVMFKFSLLASAMRHKSELGRFEYRYKIATERRERAGCAVTVSDSYSVRAEDMALAMLSFYGYQRVMVLEPWTRRNRAQSRSDSVEKN